MLINVQVTPFVSISLIYRHLFSSCGDISAYGAYDICFQVTTPTCPQFCRITAPNPDTNQPYSLDSWSDRLHCINSVIQLDVCNNGITATNFLLQNFYDITVEVGNSAGRGISTGTRILSE